jgi:LytS/YehU family sensor histidine kinase
MGTLRVEVMDDGPGLTPPSASAPREGVGLANTRARLQQLYPDQHQLTLANRPGGGVVVALCLPFRENLNGSAHSPHASAARPVTPASASIAASGLLQ